MEPELADFPRRGHFLGVAADVLEAGVIKAPQPVPARGGGFFVFFLQCMIRQIFRQDTGMNAQFQHATNRRQEDHCHLTARDTERSCSLVRTCRAVQGENTGQSSLTSAAARRRSSVQPRKACSRVDRCLSAVASNSRAVIAAQPRSEAAFALAAPRRCERAC